ncbi:FtsX-like permease family protein [Oculatella sp. LEGE 06141]|uniref:ABC transporter permease DevC n=1 Tax=Oculatella sp. LEGE 06141 TaxID=1828648 RepID=UPI0018804871|nr:FtsX-like permease family protein [Oculatella sp. LEGE 06141]
MRFRKTPLALLQLLKERSRLVVALAGIAFADVLTFVQFGLLDALYDSSTQAQRHLNADLVMINRQVKTLIDVKSFPRERLQQAMAHGGIVSVAPAYIGFTSWRNPETYLDRSILVWGIDPADPAFTFLEAKQNLDQLKLLDRILFDQTSRPEYGPIAERIEQQGSIEVQVSNQTVRTVGLFKLGASFGADGNVIASDSTFMKLFPDRAPDQIDIGLIQLEPGADIARVKRHLIAELPDDVMVITIPEFIDAEIGYWASQGTGFIFNMGVAVGFVVGIVIVYQILYANVSEHLPEYATLKAMGYSDRYLLIMLMQESLILAILGFAPGLILSLGLYQLTYAATLLPIAMNVSRAGTVLIRNRSRGGGISRQQGWNRFSLASSPTCLNQVI